MMEGTAARSGPVARDGLSSNIFPFKMTKASEHLLFLKISEQILQLV